MKKYLWTVIIMIASSINIHAEENPFALNENLQKIDRDQELLLSTFKEIEERKKIRAETVNAPTLSVGTNEEKAKDLSRLPSEDNMTVPGQEEADTVENKVVEKEETLLLVKVEEEKIKKAREEELEAEKTKARQAKVEYERIEKVKQEQVKIEEARAVQAKAKEEKTKLEEMAKKEAEKKELEIQEAKKRIKMKEEETLALEKVEKERVREVKNTIVDINLTEEELIATEEADRAYIEAVKEMDRD